MNFRIRAKNDVVLTIIVHVLFYPLVFDCFSPAVIIDNEIFFLFIGHQLPEKGFVVVEACNGVLVLFDVSFDLLDLLVESFQLLIFLLLDVNHLVFGLLCRLSYVIVVLDEGV